MITYSEILANYKGILPLPKDIDENIKLKLLPALNKFRTIYGKPMVINSGLRSAEQNGSIPGAAKKSNHLLGLAADIRDRDRSLAKYCLENLNILQECGLWMEDPQATPTWCHLQCVPPRSGSRVFKP